ncbi:MAG: hypothetical protein F6K18_03085 [Okeania sp. SIO2C2]|nr:hypothetical protein [Okeania sp. SIO2C2]
MGKKEIAAIRELVHAISVISYQLSVPLSTFFAQIFPFCWLALPLNPTYLLSYQLSVPLSTFFAQIFPFCWLALPLNPTYLLSYQLSVISTSVYIFCSDFSLLLACAAA